MLFEKFAKEAGSTRYVSDHQALRVAQIGSRAFGRNVGGIIQCKPSIVYSWVLLQEQKCDSRRVRTNGRLSRQSLHLPLP